MAKRNAIKIEDSRHLFIYFANGYNPPEHFAPKNALLSKDIFLDRARDTSKVPEAREKLTKLLDGIISKQKLTYSEDLQYFLNVVENSRPEYHVENGRLIESWIWPVCTPRLLF